MRQKVIAVVLAVAVSPLLSGCGLMFGGTRQTVRTTSSPDGVTITTVPPTSDYKTPASMSLERKNNYTLTFSAPGYTSQKLEIQKSIRGGIVVLDILAGLVPVIVDAVTGAWYKLSPDVASVTLTKIAPGPGPEEIHMGISLRGAKDTADLHITADAPGVNIHVQQR